MEPEQPTTIAEAIDAATRVLRSASPTARLDAEVLLREASGLTLADAIAHPKRRLSQTVRSAFAALIERRRRGEPVAYITGRREFWSLELDVSPATLIPRPETELLVEQALERIPLDVSKRIVDLGTGCGAIALAIANERPLAHVVATDASDAALSVARTNADRLHVTNVEFYFGEWFSPLGEQRFDVVVSNPPYLNAGDPHLREGDLPFEPRAALVAGDDALGAIRAIVHVACKYLAPEGWLLLEHGIDQAAAVRQLLRDCGYRQVQSYRDLAGHERVSAGQFP